MSNIIELEFTKKQEPTFIDVGKITRSQRKLDEGLIAPAEKEVHLEQAHEHKSEPIKSLKDIEKISEYLIKHQRYRDNMLFIVGINFGLRVSDLRTLRFAHLITEDMEFKVSFPILEKKTKNTRKVKKNRYITINDAVINAVTLYLRHNKCKLDDYLFKSHSNNSKDIDKPISRQAIDEILRNLATECGIKAHIATHSLRKTFGYHQMVMSNNDPRKLLLLQKIFGHSTSAQTLDYIGITNEEIEAAYLQLNLGGTNHYLIDSNLQETSNPVA